MGRNSPQAKRLHWHDQNGICPLCKKPIDFERITDESYANIDHKIARSHGGSDTYSNLQLAHTPCNSKKGCGCGSYAEHNGIVLPELELRVGEHKEQDFRHRLWRQQDFCCIVYSDPLLPSEVFNQDIVRVVNEELGHTECFYKFGIERGITRNLVKPKWWP